MNKIAAREPTRRRQYAALGFWPAFLVLHALLFLPIILLNPENASFLPTIHLAGRSWEEIWWQVAIWRRTPDLLRFNVELILCIGLWMGWPRLRKSGMRHGFVIFYLFLFAYYLYEGVSLTFFNVEPVFYSQFRIATAGFSFFLQNARVSFGLVAGVVLLIAAGTALVIWLARVVLPADPSRLGLPARSALGLLLLLTVLQVFTQGQRLGRSEMIFGSLAVKLAQNISESFQVYSNVQRFDDAEVRLAYDYSGYRLDQRPNVYIIFIESYGSVLYKRPDWRSQYQALTQRLEETLAAAGWYAASARSLAPTWGGGSWMSYTSALFGLRVDSDPQYHALLDKYHLEEYPDFGRFLKAQGYDYYRLTALSVGLPKAMWRKYTSFFGVDRWLRYQDLNFVGPEYGWGPAPPDQFSLNFVRQLIQRETDGPFLFFTITQNSHYPWTPLPALHDTWQALNTPGDLPPPTSELIEHSQRRQNYWDAIEYQLEMLTAFILHEPRPAIFVLVGDHQPPRVSRREDGWDTPIHIVAKNQQFVVSFEEYGFTRGLAVWQPQPTFRHEGFYSLFVRQLLAAYGSGSELPTYLAEGVRFGESGMSKEER